MVDIKLPYDRIEYMLSDSKPVAIITNKVDYTFFHRQLDFSSEPGDANEILENEPKGCLTFA